MILYCKDSLGCVDNNNIELINNVYYILYALLFAQIAYFNKELFLLLDTHDIFDCDEVDTVMSHSGIKSSYFTIRITGFSCNCKSQYFMNIYVIKLFIDIPVNIF